MRSFRLCSALLGWFAIVSQFWLGAVQFGLLAGTVIFFTFFTLLGNILVAAALSAPLLPPSNATAFFSRPGVRTAIAVYILVVGVIFYFLLRKLYDPSGFAGLVNDLLHYAMPVLYIADWVGFVPKQGLTYRHIPYWLIFPLLYAGITLLHGAFSGYYPYPFLDAGKFGYRVISINIAALALFFILVSAGFVAAGQVLSRRAGHLKPG